MIENIIFEPQIKWNIILPQKDSTLYNRPILQKKNSTILNFFIKFMEKILCHYIRNYTTRSILPHGLQSLKYSLSKLFYSIKKNCLPLA